MKSTGDLSFIWKERRKKQTGKGPGDKSSIIRKVHPYSRTVILF